MNSWKLGLAIVLALLGSGRELPARDGGDEREETRQFWLKEIEKIKTRAEAGDHKAQDDMARYYLHGFSMGDVVIIEKNEAEAVRLWRMQAEQGDVEAAGSVGLAYKEGIFGVKANLVEAVKWLRKAALQGDEAAQAGLGEVYYTGGPGVGRNPSEAVLWLHKAAEQGMSGGYLFVLPSQYLLARCYAEGDGVGQDFVESYKWLNIASSRLGTIGNGASTMPTIISDDMRNWGQRLKGARNRLAARMTPEQIAEAQRLAREYKMQTNEKPPALTSEDLRADSSPRASGTGFFISEDGFFVTNDHVVNGAAHIRLLTKSGTIAANIVKTDVANDIALLKTTGRFCPLPVAPSRMAHLGSTVVTLGFPNIDLQGFAPKLAKGEIAALTGAQDDPKYFQISVPVQPGNSGGALVDERGNVVGVVSAKLDAAAALATSGSLPENVNYAVKSSFLLSFLESVPEVSAKLKDPNTKELKFEDVVKQAEEAAVLVLVY
jgi:S1-C subfamily serine protease